MADLTWNKTFVKKAEAQFEKDLEAAAFLYQRRVKRGMNRHASNKGSGGAASPVGRPPGNKTGRLSRSIVVVDRSLPGRPTFVVGTNVVYARIHEFGGVIQHPGGTPYFFDKEKGRVVFVSKAKGKGLPVTRPHAIRMPKRPVWRPTYAATLRFIEKMILNGQKKVLNKTKVV